MSKKLNPLFASIECQPRFSTAHLKYSNDAIKAHNHNFPIIIKHIEDDVPPEMIITWDMLECANLASNTKANDKEEITNE